MRKSEPYKRHPLYQHENPLDLGLDGIGTPEEMTPEQRASAFLSNFQQYQGGTESYRRYLESSAKEASYIFLEIKRYYIALVVRKGWTERKYLDAICEIFDKRMILGTLTLDRIGLKIDRDNAVRDRRRR